ncbi:MAG: PorV/PorQ family protein [Bacteroidia bacterium]|jgi:hypothetical protein|nr:PorV/PorQ family protein [Bacteroidia bacterium]
MTREKISLLLFLITATTICRLNAQPVTGSEIFGFFDYTNSSFPAFPHSSDARSCALGGNGVALTADAGSFYRNASRLAFADGNSGASVSWNNFSQLGGPNKYRMYQASFFRRLKANQAIGVNVRRFTTGEIYIAVPRVFPLILLGKRRLTETAVDVAYTRLFGKYFSASVTARVMQSDFIGDITMTSKGGYAVSGDIGFFYQRADRHLWGKPAKVTAGLALNHAGGKTRYSNSSEERFSPAMLNIGAGWVQNAGMRHELGVYVQAQKMLVPSYPIYVLDSLGRPVPLPGGNGYQIAAGKDPNRPVLSGMFGSFNDSPLGLSYDMKEIFISAGAEYWFAQFIALRAGGNFQLEGYEALQMLTMGVGVRYNAFEFGFAYLHPTTYDRGITDETLHFTLCYRAKAKELPERKKLPERTE